MRKEELEWADREGRRPLHHACHRDNAVLVEALVAAGCDAAAAAANGKMAWEMPGGGGLFGRAVPPLLQRLADAEAEAEAATEPACLYPAIFEIRAALRLRPGQFVVSGAGTALVNGDYRDDGTLERPPAGMLDFAPVPQFRMPGTSILLRRQGPHWCAQAQVGRANVTLWCLRCVCVCVCAQVDRGCAERFGPAAHGGGGALGDWRRDLVLLQLCATLLVALLR